MTTKKEFKNIKKALIKENSDNLNHALSNLGKTSEYIKTPQESLNWTCRNVLNKRDSYKGTIEDQKQKITTALKRVYEKRLNEELAYLNEIENAKPYINEYSLAVEWKNSRMWGFNPTATDSDGNTSGSIGGCGYCKHSTATARVLNQNLSLIYRMCELKEKYLKNNPNTEENQNDINRKVLGYGSGYGIIPRFEGGVGVNCHITILYKCGVEMREISNTKHTNTYLIREVA